MHDNMANSNSLSLVHSSSQYADVSTNITNGLTKLTVMCWIKPTTLNTNYAIVTNWPNTNTQFIFRENSASGDLICYIATSASSDDATKFCQTATGVISTGSWQHVAFVYDGTQGTNNAKLKIYVNGIDKSNTYSGTLPTALTTITGRIQIGARDDVSDYFDGLIDEVKIINDALTASQIISYYQCDSSPAALAYWAMNNNLNDSSGNGLTLTGHGTPTFSSDLPFASYSCPSGGMNRNYAYFM